MVNSNKKGFTLTELTIVLALISIMSVLVISFSAFAKNYTTTITSEEAILADFDNIKDVFDTWVTSVDSSEYTISIDDNSILKATDKTNTYTLSLSNVAGTNVLLGTLPGDNKKQTFFQGTGTLDEIYFSSYKNGTNGCLAICLKVKYSCDSNSKLLSEDRYFIKTMRSQGSN